jgi:segregation and condensation protein A
VIETNSDSVSTSTDATDASPAQADSVQAEGSEGGRVWRGVKLPIFEGPLDLLLHLIRTNEVDISDIPIALISEQYLEYLELMKLLDIDVAAEYLLMAATLAYIKSRMLLPVDPDSEGEEAGDPRAELARRLAEYAVFKEAAAELGERPWLGRDVFGGEPDRSELPEREAELAVDVNDLIRAMQRVLAELPEDARHHEVERERVSAQDRMLAVMDQLRAGAGAILFDDLLRDIAHTRHVVLMTFLAILELAKIQALRIFQNATPEGRPHGPIRVRLAVEDAGEEDPLG